MKTHKYSNDDLTQFEKRWRVTLPAEYRLYLMDHGCDVDGRAISFLEEWCQPRDEDQLSSSFLSTPFPHSSPWNDESLRDGQLDYKAPYFRDELWTGAMRIVNVGCEGYYLLIVSGPERGNIWSDYRVCYGTGFSPLTLPSFQRIKFSQLVSNLSVFLPHRFGK